MYSNYRGIAPIVGGGGNVSIVGGGRRNVSTWSQPDPMSKKYNPKWSQLGNFASQMTQFGLLSSMRMSQFGPWVTQFWDTMIGFRGDF